MNSVQSSVPAGTVNATSSHDCALHVCVRAYLQQFSVEENVRETLGEDTCDARRRVPYH
jgi:hypothetical protein